jgi:ubiquitin-protein ligase E3 C
VLGEFGAQVELVPGGLHREVTDLNKLEYIHRFVDYKVHRQFEACVLPLLAGFSRVFPFELLRVFDETELARVLNGGLAEVDVDDLRKHTEYRAGYAAKDSYMKVRAA